MSNITDPYQILGVSPNATDDEVKKAYRELSRKYHPDANAGNPLSDLAEEKFKQLQEAYSQIMDMRNGKTSYNGYNQGTQCYSQGTQGYSQGAQGYGYNQNNNRQRYQQYGSGYGRGPYGNNLDNCSTGNICCDLWCADSLCECMGGDLCSCI